jgi:UDP-4-amino-4,6-dideoxy-N-acetyl-beta-L-altrosamine N-acetyltransferase
MGQGAYVYPLSYWVVIMLDSCSIRSLTEKDLPMVLAWRNHPSVRQFMLTQHEISLAEHRDWFVRCGLDTRRRLLIVTEDNQALGYVQFSGVVEGGIAEWGFYSRPDAPKGSGKKIGLMALEYAFGELKLHKVCGQALETNRASIAFHRRLGFQQEGLLRDQKQIEGQYCSLYCFGLFADEWARIKLV